MRNVHRNDMTHIRTFGADPGLIQAPPTRHAQPLVPLPRLSRVPAATRDTWRTAQTIRRTACLLRPPLRASHARTPSRLRPVPAAKTTHARARARIIRPRPGPRPRPRLPQPNPDFREDGRTLFRDLHGPFAAPPADDREFPDPAPLSYSL